VGEWIDLLDPTSDQLRATLPPDLHESDLTKLAAPGAAGRPGLVDHDGHVFGVLIVPVADRPADDVFYQEIDVVLTAERLITVRKTTPGRPAFDTSVTRETCRPDDGTERCFYRLVDAIADRYLDLVDDVEDEIGELEDHVEQRSPAAVGLQVRRLRHQILHVRRTLAPMRDAVRAVADGRVRLPAIDPSPAIQHDFAGVHDRLLRAADGLELAHDLLAGVRDYSQAKAAQDQNDVIRRLTAVASLILVPTFIVGLYGQNFLDMPEFHWGIWGYIWSWGLILVVTLVQLWYFRRKRWL